MSLFKYKALDENNCIIESSVKALSFEEAKHIITEDGLTPIKIEESKGMDSISFEVFTSIHIQDIIIFCRELSIIIKSGISLTVGLDILKKQASERLKKVVEFIGTEIQKGMTLSQAMKDSEYKFPQLLIRMVAAGQASGNLEDVLDNMADYYERENYIKQKIKSATIYPIILVVIAVGLIIFFSNFILPTMEELLFGQELPMLTKAVISLAKFAGSIYSLVSLLLLIITFFLFKRFLPQDFTRKYKDIIVLRVPVLGSLIKDIITVRFVRTLYLLTKSGIDIVNILDILKSVVSNYLAEEALDTTLEGVKRGEKLASLLESTKFFEPLVVQMIGVGEEAGELERILHEISEFYEKRLELKIEKFVAMLEPLFTLVIGGIIALVIVAIAMPIFGMVGNINSGNLGGLN